MRTKTMRVPEQVHNEIIDAADMLGYTPAELLARAWSTYRQSDEFHDDFAFAQKAFSQNDPDTVMKLLHQRRQQRASRKASVSRSGR